MHARRLFEVLLRVLGMFLLAWAFDRLVQSVVQACYLWSFFARTSAEWIGPAYVLFTGLAMLSAGLFLLLRAPRIAAKTYPEAHADGEPLRFGTIGAGDLYRITSFGIGIVFVVLALAAGARTAVGLALQSSFSGSIREIDDLATAIVYGLSGLVLTFGSRQIGAWMATLRYDPDTIPAQQFSLRVLLIVITLVGVALAAIRYWRV